MEAGVVQQIEIIIREIVIQSECALSPFSSFVSVYFSMFFCLPIQVVWEASEVSAYEGT